MTKAKQAEQDAPEAEEAPEPAPYEAKIIEPEEPADTPTETPLEIPEGHEAVRYVGAADLFEYGAYQFRDGKPVIVPSDVAEELLTIPFERFERL